MKTLYQLLLDRWNQNCDTVLVTIVEGNGSIPRTTGAYMAADQTGRIYGTIGGGNLEYQAVKKAITLAGKMELTEIMKFRKSMPRNLTLMERFIFSEGVILRRSLSQYSVIWDFGAW